MSAEKREKIGNCNPPKSTQFKPGNPGGGRPKGSVSIVKHLRAALQEQDEARAKQLASALILQAAKGNGAAIKAILERIDGPVKEVVDASHTIRVVYGDDDSPAETPSGAEDC